MPDNNKLAFTSKFRYEQFILRGSVPFSVTYAEFYKEFFINHNLGYIPFFRLWYDYGDGRILECFAGPTSYDASGNGGQIDNITADTSKILIGVENFGAGPTVSGRFYYRIYKEPLS
jgi:hypothetical protein